MLCQKKGGLSLYILKNITCLRPGLLRTGRCFLSPVKLRIAGLRQISLSRAISNGAFTLSVTVGLVLAVLAQFGMNGVHCTAIGIRKTNDCPTLCTSNLLQLKASYILST
jgi:hypothetical protein